MQGRCRRDTRGDIGEIQGRYRGDTGEIQGLVRLDAGHQLVLRLLTEEALVSVRAGVRVRVRVRVRDRVRICISLHLGMACGGAFLNCTRMRVCVVSSALPALRYTEIWGDIRRYTEIWGGVGRHGEV